ncbi:hypothetical protein SKAU_G00311750 [Synaphobranchus kaupii]|uniref:Uncharacterized protein n=1 Tax=Synaphobranchus kaupii TaxID=118154 RepID=A0A9Q1ERU6_SYNKA|nr:hypothetical protein SKAU_G00311750 [Synaphobranchus kaupii]
MRGREGPGHERGGWAHSKVTPPTHKVFLGEEAGRGFAACARWGRGWFRSVVGGPRVQQPLLCLRVAGCERVTVDRLISVVSAVGSGQYRLQGLNIIMDETYDS